MVDLRKSGRTTGKTVGARITDWGSGFNLDKVLAGELEPVVAACVAMDEKEKLEQLAKEAMTFSN